MPDLTKLSGPKLEALIEARREIDLAACKRCIALGLGQWRYSDMRDALDGKRVDCDYPQLAAMRRNVEASAALREALDEMDARKRYHGSNRPIRGASAY